MLEAVLEADLKTKLRKNGIKNWKIYKSFFAKLSWQPVPNYWTKNGFNASHVFYTAMMKQTWIQSDTIMTLTLQVYKDGTVYKVKETCIQMERNLYTKWTKHV